jgi:hypothetical protein
LRRRQRARTRTRRPFKRTRLCRRNHSRTIAVGHTGENVRRVGCSTQLLLVLFRSTLFSTLSSAHSTCGATHPAPALQPQAGGQIGEPLIKKSFLKPRSHETRQYKTCHSLGGNRLCTLGVVIFNFQFFPFGMRTKLMPPTYLRARAILLSPS